MTERSYHGATSYQETDEQGIKQVNRQKTTTTTTTTTDKPSSGLSSSSRGPSGSQPPSHPPHLKLITEPLGDRSTI